MKKTTVPWSDSQKIVRQLLLTTTISAEKYFKGRLLDVGCGKKPYRQFLADSNIQDWIGIDFPASTSGKTEADVYGNALEIPFIKETFDTVFCSQVLEHVSDPDQVIREMARILKPGGHLILTSPQTWCLHEEPHDYYRFTKYGLSFLVQKNGLIIESVKSYGGTIAQLGQLIILHSYSDFIIFKMLSTIFSYIILKLDRMWFKDKDVLGNIIIGKKPL